MTDETTHAAHGCEEYERASRLSRRGFMQGMAAGTAALATTQMFGDAVMEASYGATGGNVLVVLSFRGGIDGLGMVVPHGDPDYYRARPNLAVAEVLRARRRRDLRPAPPDGAAGADVERPQDGGGARGRAWRSRTARTSRRSRWSRTPAPAPTSVVAG